MMWLWILALVLTWASAENLEERILGEVLASQSTGTLEQTISAWRRWKIAQQACEMERIQRQVPKSCFEALHWEQRWRSSDDSEKRRQLNRECHEATDLQVADLESPYLSSECAQRVQRTLEIQKYRAEDWPDF